MRVVRSLALLLPGLCACQPSTTRPAFLPLPEAERVEVRLLPLEATRKLSEVLETDSIPPGRIELRDGFIESHWFDPSTGQPSTRRPIGTGIVRVRAWADPARPGFSMVTVETVYQPLADASLPPRELERQVPKDHPVAVKVRTALQDLVKRFGGPPVSEPAQPRVREEQPSGPPDEAEPTPQE
jgi:hypothetical protein